jgi:hypothetical protein
VEGGIPFIFATGYGSSGLEEAYASRLTLQKPFNMEALGQGSRKPKGSVPHFMVGCCIDR